MPISRNGLTKVREHIGNAPSRRTARLSRAVFISAALIATGAFAAGEQPAPAPAPAQVAPAGTTAQQPAAPMVAPAPAPIQPGAASSPAARDPGARPAASGAAASAAGAKAPQKNPAKPQWTDLTPAQQQALSPLAPEWLKYPEDANALLPKMWARDVARGAGGELEISGIPVSELKAAHEGWFPRFMDQAS